MRRCRRLIASYCRCALSGARWCHPNLLPPSSVGLGPVAVRSIGGTFDPAPFADRHCGHTEIVMLNPWIFGLESVHQAWRAQSAMAPSSCDYSREFSDPSPLIPDTVAVDIKAQEDGTATVADVPKAPAAIADVPQRKVPKASRVSKRASRVKPRIASKRAAAASQNRASKVVRRSKRKPR
jgi:hypothetical protein